MIKVTFIGAGSTVFMKNILTDILLEKNFSNCEIVLQDIDDRRLKTSNLVAEKVAKSTGGKIISTGVKTSKSVIDSVAVRMAAKAVVKSLKKAAEKGSENITDDTKYTKIIEKTWEVLPLPIRLVGKDTLKFNDVMFRIRNTVFDSSKNDLEINKKASAKFTKEVVEVRDLAREKIAPA